MTSIIYQFKYGSYKIMTLKVKHYLALILAKSVVLLRMWHLISESRFSFPKSVF